jgi:hypothetical protein
VESQFTGSSKAYTSSLIKILISEKYTGGDVRDHILRMSNIATRLKPLDLAIKDGVLIYLIFNSFSKEFETFEVNYNFMNDKCTLKKFIAMCVQEEERIKHNNSGVFQEPIVNHEEEQQQLLIQDVSRNEPPKRSQKAKRSAISEDYKV